MRSTEMTTLDVLFVETNNYSCFFDQRKNVNMIVSYDDHEFTMRGRGGGSTAGFGGTGVCVGVRHGVRSVCLACLPSGRARGVNGDDW